MLETDNEYSLELLRNMNDFTRVKELNKESDMPKKVKPINR